MTEGVKVRDGGDEAGRASGGAAAAAALYALS